MSKVVIAGNASGTGVYTLEAPNGNTDRTLVLPDEAGTVLTSASPVVLPKGTYAFRVNTTTAMTNTAYAVVKVPFNLINYDYSNGFNTTNNRFQPDKAGIYSFSVSIRYSSGFSRFLLHLYKNGAETVSLLDHGAGAYAVNGTGSLYLNGSTDYVEVYQQTDTTTALQTASSSTWFTGHLVEAL